MIFFTTWIIFVSSQPSNTLTTKGTCYKRSLLHFSLIRFDWGAKVQKKADQIQTLLLGKEELREARLKALKITSQINGFGNSASFSAPSPPPSPASSSPLNSSGTTLTEREAVSESDSLIGDKDERNRTAGEETLISGICSKLAGLSPLKKLHGGRTAAGFHALSNVERVSSKCYDRRNSIGY